MRSISESIRDVAERLNIERVAAILSVFYCVGVILQLQYYSIYVGDFDFDFVRVKPIIVGIEYFIYLLLPLAVVYFPIVITSNKCSGWFWSWYKGNRRQDSLWKIGIGYCIRVVICILLFSIFVFLSGLMFHYFFPYTEYLYDSSGFLMDLVKMSAAFWKQYLYWDINVLAFLFLFIVGALWSLRYCETVRFVTKGRKRFFTCMTLIFGLLGFFTNMFYFNRDVYWNISQGAAGGAPVSGIITISSPGLQARKGVDGTVLSCDEITRFCRVLQSDPSYLYIDDQLIGDRGSIGGTHIRTRVNTTRIKKEDVKQFTPIVMPVFYQGGSCTVFGQAAMQGVIQNLDLFVEYHFDTANRELARHASQWFNVTNEITAIWQADNFPQCVAKASGQRVVTEGVTNFCYTAEFRNVAVPIGTLIPEFIACMTNSYAQCTIVNLPTLPKGVCPGRLALGFQINYFSTFVFLDRACKGKYDRVLALTVDPTEHVPNCKLPDMGMEKAMRK